MNHPSTGFAWTIAMTLLFAGATGWAESPALPPPSSSPRALVSSESCAENAPCPPGYWVFLAPDCRYHDLWHPAGAVILLESGTTLQCRCSLVWLLTKKEEPPSAKVSCEWVDLGEAPLEY